LKRTRERSARRNQVDYSTRIFVKMFGPFITRSRAGTISIRRLSGALAPVLCIAACRTQRQCLGIQPGSLCADSRHLRGGHRISRAFGNSLDRPAWVLFCQLYYCPNLHERPERGWRLRWTRRVFGISINKAHLSDALRPRRPANSVFSEFSRWPVQTILAFIIRHLPEFLNIHAV
jgi:hypothetical protein